MSTIPKHEARPKSAKKQPQTAVVEHATPAIPLDVDLTGIEAVMEKIGNSLKSYNVNACDGNNSLNLFTGTHDNPVRLVLEGEAVDSIADSLKRIADAMTPQRST